MTSRRVCLRSLGALGFAALIAGLPADAPAQSQSYPNRPIRFLIHTAPGSLVDVLGRIVAQELGERLGQTLVVDNRPGAATMIAAEQLIRSPADGYTLMINTSESTMLPFLKRSYKYDPVKDFTPIALAVTSWTVFAVNPKVQANTLQELVALSKTQGGGIRVGHGGTGGALHIAVEMLKLRSGGNFVHVPYRGGGPAAQDAIAGQIEGVSMGIASTRIAEGGKLRVIAQAGPRRHPILPNVPTTGEAGFTDVQMETWFGLVGPPNLPKEIADRIAGALAEVSRQPAYQERLFKLGMAVDYKTGPDLIAFINRNTAKWKELIPAMGIPQVD